MDDIVRLDLGEGSVILLMCGDITEQDTDAIVNAANSSLMGGGGVDGAIHRAGGPAIVEECKKIVSAQGRLPSGQAVATTGGKLKSAFVIHTVGPVWQGGDSGEAEILASCHSSAIAVADQLHLRSVAFPAISTGVYGYPVEEAAPVALQATCNALRTAKRVREARFVLFGERVFAQFDKALQQLTHPSHGEWRYKLTRIAGLNRS